MPSMWGGSKEYNQMKIIQIVVNGTTTQGLGDDGKLYKFNPQSQQWELLEAEE